MAQHARGATATPAVRQAVAKALAWHDSRPRASMSSPRGWLWMLLVAALVFWMSNPLVILPGFHLSLAKAVTWTGVAVVLTLPWLRLPRVPWPWIVFHGLCALSILWTIDPHLTDYTNVLYLKITVIALIVAANCDPLVMCLGLGLGGVVVTVLSVYAFHAGLWGASYTATTSDGAEILVLAGVGANENILSYTLVLALAGVLAAGREGSTAGRLALVAVGAVNLYGLYLARSGTGLLTLLTMAAVLAVAIAWPTLRARSTRQLLSGAAAVLGSLVAALLFVVVVLDKDLTSLNGRAPFWGATWDATIERAPLLGSGWGAVWPHPWSMVPSNPVAQDIFERAQYVFAHGHNAFLDLLPELGLVGVTLVVGLVVLAARDVGRAGVRPGDHDPVGGRLLLLVLTAVLVSGIAEPLLTAPLGWWALTLAVGSVRQRILVPDDADGRRHPGAPGGRPEAAHRQSPLGTQGRPRSTVLAPRQTRRG